MSESINIVRGDSLAFVVSLTVDDQPLDWDAWAPAAQVRRRANGPVVAEFTITTDGQEPGSARFSLADEDTAALEGDYVWDVQFSDPDADPGDGTVTWPSAGARHTLTVAADVTREEVGS